MTAPFSKILTPVYFDETSPAPLQYARHFARHSDGTVYLLHVVPTDEFHLLRTVYRPEDGGGADAQRATQVAGEKLQLLGQEHLAGVHWEVVVQLNPDPVSGILAAEKSVGADLVVMATHGRTGMSHLILGSVAEKVVRESHCPVFTTRRSDSLSDSEPFQRILVSIDIAEKSVAALTCARRMAEAFKSIVYPLHVVPTDETDLLLRDVYEAREGGHKVNLVVAERVARQKLAALAQEHLSGVRYETVLHVSDDPARTILQTEQEVNADLLMLTTHGFLGVFHLLAGSLTEKMVREAHSPVLSLHR
jgi:nucleotide-binding universal stress UspA family protein